jgi:nucleotidyltransferase/DNA polymerase involved in DNA repair
VGRDSYFDGKRRKLNEWNDARQNEADTDLFKGVSIWINGLVTPFSSNDLRDMVVAHGGKHSASPASYPTVTHVIARVVPDGKVGGWDGRQNAFNRQVVLRPEWIVESIRAGRRLREDDYVVVSRAPPGNERIESTVARMGPFRGGAPAIGSTKDNAEFVPQYYNRSRLSFLSTFRMELREQAIDLAARARAAALPAVVTARVQGLQPAMLVRAVMHVDMDCFFASVAQATHPELRGKPVVVAHGPEGQVAGGGEVAAASYEARAFGVRAGMGCGRALELCPAVVRADYQFEDYRRVSAAVYELFFAYSRTVEVVSCDEAFLELALDPSDPESHAMEIALALRAEILAATGCPASAGVGPNKLLARVATAEAKPNGQRFLRASEALAFLRGKPVDALPGVGYSLAKLLRERSRVETCADLERFTLPELQGLYGARQGVLLYQGCRGVDPREVTPTAARKTVGSMISWGVRFDRWPAVLAFALEVCETVSRRAEQAGLVGRKVAVDIMLAHRNPGVNASRRKGDLGHGVCDSFNRTVPLPAATRDKHDLHKAVVKAHAEVVAQLGLSHDEVAVLYRGLGVALQGLEDPGKAQAKRAAFFGNAAETGGPSRALLARRAEANASVAARESREGLYARSDDDDDEEEEEEEEEEGWGEVGDEEVVEVVEEEERGGEPVAAPVMRRGPLASRDLMPTLSQVDPECLDALPEDIRKEVMRQSAAARRRDLTTMPPPPPRKPPPAASGEATASNKQDSRHRYQQVRSPTRVFQKESFDEATADLLVSWCSGIQTVTQAHVDFLVGLGAQLYADGDHNSLLALTSLLPKIQIEMPQWAAALDAVRASLFKNLM